MSYPDHPTVSVDFISNEIVGSVELAGNFRVGSTHNFVVAGTKPIHKRLISIREIIPGEISLEQATGIAINLRFLGSLMEWLEKNRNWKEGGYIDT